MTTNTHNNHNPKKQSNEETETANQKLIDFLDQMTITLLLSLLTVTVIATASLPPRHCDYMHSPLSSSPYTTCGRPFSVNAQFWKHTLAVNWAVADTMDFLLASRSNSGPTAL